MLVRKLSAIAIILLLISPFAQADENLWVYTKGTDTRPKGSFEIKLNDISRFGKDSGSYTFHDIRPEIEYGITNRLTVTGAVLIFHHDYSGVEVGNDPVNETQTANGGSVDETTYGGFEVKVKYNIFSPYKDWAGLSVGFAYEKRNRYRLDGAKINQDSLVPMIFLQKNFLDDTLVFAFTGKMELERRTAGAVLEEEIAFDISFGAAYRVAPKWFVGLEIRSQSDYLSPEEDNVPLDPTLDRSSWDIGDFRLGTQHQNGNYIGPSIHYGEERWYATVGALWQFAGGGNDNNSFTRDGKNFDEHEKLHVGFSIGYNF